MISKFSQRVKELRNGKGYSQEKLAELTNLSRETIAEIHAGVSPLKKIISRNGLGVRGRGRPRKG